MSNRPESTPIAVVGLSGIFPGAPDPDRFWQNIVDRIEGIDEVPKERWVLSPDRVRGTAAGPDRAVSVRAGLVREMAFDPATCRLGKGVVRDLDPLHHMALAAGKAAWSSFEGARIDPVRAGVILAAIALPTDASSGLCRSLFDAHLEQALTAAHRPIEAGRQAAAAARVTGLPAAVIARELGLGGICFTLDAACASSLYAVKLACDELRTGRSDAMLAGGVSRPDCLYTQIGFSQLRALSPTGRCAAFDAAADGLVVGEGCGVLVLKRLEDALAQGDRIWGVIRGIGLSNDMRGNLLAPDSEGQVRAMAAAYREAGWRPDQVDLIECHGAGTPVGDRTEVESLVRLWAGLDAAAGVCPIGSVKTVTGHMLVAAGAAGMIKTLLAMDRETLPPSLHFSEPPTDSPLAGGPFRVQTEAAPWPRRGPAIPRRAAVSAFGFGGINAHLLLEEWIGPERQDKNEDRIRPPASRVEAPETINRTSVAVVGMAAAFGGCEDTDRFVSAAMSGTDATTRRPAHRWKGIDASLPDRLAREFSAGGFMDEISVGIGEFRIPPSELPDILPQHLLMLRVAGRALADAGLEIGAERTGFGAVIGIDFDYEATNFQYRWHLDAASSRWTDPIGVSLVSTPGSRWFSGVKDAFSPPLNADRTLGALAGLIGSRIAREYAFGGPSFTVSDGPASGLRALEIAARALVRGEVDLMIAGAVDFAGDVRASWIASALAPSLRPGDGAAALVCKRLDDAVADGDRIYAVLKGTGTSGSANGLGPTTDSNDWNRSLSQALAQAGVDRGDIGLLEVAGAVLPEIDLTPLPTPSRIDSVVGTPGAAAGMAGLVRAAAALFQRRLPAGRGAAPLPWTAAPGATRRACVAASSFDGNCVHAVLEEAPEMPAPPPPNADRKEPDGRSIVIPVGGGPIRIPDPPAPEDPSDRAGADRTPGPAPGSGETDRLPNAGVPVRETGPASLLIGSSDAVSRAHEKFLAFSEALNRAYAEALDLQRRLIEAAGAGNQVPGPVRPLQPPAAPPAYSRDLCMEFAVGSVAKVLGPAFAEVDRYRVRVRLPDEPLMLVDRILSVQGEKGSLSSGRVVTEHDVLPGAWYLDGGRAPVCISVEAGQADLFLCSYLGIDLKVKGERAYRLLDATVSFHRGLPQPGETIRYEIEIEKFVRQGDTWLFFFHFDGFIDGLPLITMTDGCAGFFTPEEVENSGGILPGEDENRPASGKSPSDWAPPVPMGRESYDEEALAALREGDARRCFGDFFSGVTIPGPLRLPGGRMHLIDRIVEIDPAGGRCGLGMIRAEADVHPDAWFLTCHFVDDMVMPGTLMYECCAHTLRVFLQRLGWFTDAATAVYEPKPGVKSVLKCRGPVTPETRSVLYEVDIRELGFDPFPYVVADALMVADGRRIVRFRDMSMQVTGLTREQIEAFWHQHRRKQTGGPVRGADRPTDPSRGGNRPVRAGGGPPVFTRQQILAYARGRPSEAFGPRYAPFDEGRFLARLPSPPYSFIDRVVRVEPPAQVMAPGGWVEAEFVVDPGAWYFRANRSPSMPYCVLQEAALQVCGFTAAYVGSSLTSEKDLRFRNLGGEAVQLRDVAPSPQVLTARCRLTRVNTAADMILQDYRMAVHDKNGQPVYEGSTHFGFFTEAALSRQVGIRDAEQFAHNPDRDELARAAHFDLEPGAPLFPEDPDREPVDGPALPAKALLMIDRVLLFVPDGGPHGLGYVKAEKSVDPGEWFFAAHFFQDPVCPGSLGLESFLQVLKFAALRRFGVSAENRRFAPFLGEKHRWTYRGQILPTNGKITVEAVVTRIEEAPEPMLVADGLLRVDGLVIYRMENFGVRLVSD